MAPALRTIGFKGKVAFGKKHALAIREARPRMLGFRLIQKDRVVKLFTCAPCLSEGAVHNN